MNGMSRRTFVGIGAAVAAGAAAPTLTGCGSATPKKTEAASASVKLPTYVPYEGVKPDLPGNSKGLEAGFLSYPKNLVRSVAKPPGDGSKVTLLTEIWTPPPAAQDANAHWQQLNKKLGVDLSVIMGTDPGYDQKFAATVAGDALPDLMWIPPNQGIQHVAQLLEAKCADITELVSGDAVKAYPHLAAMTPQHWKTAVVNGRIWGAPSPYPAFGQVYSGNPNIWDKAEGLSASSPDEFLAKCKEVTGGKVWALEPIYNNAVSVMSQCFGAPNKWERAKDGSLTFWQETDAYAEALNFVIKLKQAGVFYPGNPEMADAYLKMAQGSIGACVYANPTNARKDLRINAPELTSQILVPFAAGGSGGPRHHLHLGTIGYTAIKKGDEKRVRMLLSILNYLAAPFGTEEREFQEFGTRDLDFTFDKNGFPARTAQGKKEVEGLRSGMETATVSPSALMASMFEGNARVQDVKDVYAVEQKLIPMGIALPTAGHYSDAYTEYYPRMSTDAKDLVNDIVSGRKSMKEWKPFWADWKNRGLDKMRKEFQKSMDRSGE
ncbi:hypothetical protein ACIO3O_24410 [Streptomyces sp. NPDC087440]|uniref:hypothetical protein n=1 Tax=Streptomyces sp. NPDC087440 TaxID=3365790 RepID=UPI0037FD2762